jgi:hypothetical protein
MKVMDSITQQIASFDLCYTLIIHINTLMWVNTEVSDSSRSAQVACQLS